MRVALLTVAAALVFTAASPASSSFAPTRAAAAHWKAVAFKPANLGYFWRGYFSGSPKMTGCHSSRAGSIRTYECTVENIDTPIADAYLFRTGPCTYGYLIGTMDGTRKFHRTFRFCG